MVNGVQVDAQRYQYVHSYYAMEWIHNYLCVCFRCTCGGRLGAVVAQQATELSLLKDKQAADSSLLKDKLQAMEFQLQMTKTELQKTKTELQTTRTDLESKQTVNGSAGYNNTGQYFSA